MVEMTLVLLAMLLFGVIHSLTAGRFKAVFRRWFGERAYHGLYRLLYNGFALLTLMPAALLMAFNDGGVVWQVPAPFEIVFWGIQAAGLVGLVVSTLQIDVLRFAGVTQFLNYLTGGTLPLADEPLQIGGLYAWVRHPLYLFSLMVVWPVTTMTWGYLGLSVGMTLYFIVGSLYEERRLLAAYGDTYAHYRARVPWLLPYPRRKAAPEVGGR